MKISLRSMLFPVLAALLVALPAQAALKVATLHPLLGDLARQVGGDKVEVIDLLKPGGDAHHFEPTSKDLGNLKGTALILASGKHLESYLGKLSDSVGGGTKIIEVGRPIPSIKIEAGGDLFLCCPAHAAGGIDPHWWHSVDNMKRAARVIADEFATADASNADAYRANAEAVQKKLSTLKGWAQQQITAIPKSDRKLVTAHASFSYFCKEFGFKSVPVLGIGREDEATPKYVVETIKTIRDNKIRAVFPEDQANPKVLQEIVRETGIKVGTPLIADGTSSNATTFEAMFRHNVTAIVEALKP
ncbi:metal ABC transporter substrate-binding protein [Verrucomicrobium sp. BvORR106]|uniref:metal ABC transporter substrate-binding protein n=1 Tax=Verrucomicrobium sp. BvORR106 TaxID=1403819 RepID=UPI00056FD068|nr:metal ABC transporter substrate-binding protein [Verrucomicrobium sp. BvORR106]